MDFLKRIEKCFGNLIEPSPQELREALDKLRITPEDLIPFLENPGFFPYGRKLLLKTDHVEILVMNWAYNFECSPHDHGNSFGWVAVVNGESTHTMYTLNQRDVPVPYLSKVENTGRPFFAPKGFIHQMVNFGEEGLVTFHVYSPPITGMKVYDLERCVGCVVSDDCGAWWPTEQRQMLQLLKLDQANQTVVNTQ
ncbi:cysteine dioxygenase [Effusibacillus consociatus]|uniref:Cysteine dioxygenase n=1 Tax=Effusibacillus consociatus TaxID=1117041 RepID=A0ABV9Q0Z2_9BACL